MKMGTWILLFGLLVWGAPRLDAHAFWTRPKDAEVADLPLIEVPATGPSTDTLTVLMSGDGGWARLDKDLGSHLAGCGYPVIGLNSLFYFWKARTPEGSAKDLERILRHYLKAWGKTRIMLIGYSYGADVMPFMVNRLPQDLLERVSLTVLIGLSRSVAFEFHLAEWFGGTIKGELPVLPEIQKLKGTRIVCIRGAEERDAIYQELDPTLAKQISLPGAHHFNRNYTALGELILKELNAHAPE